LSGYAVVRKVVEAETHKHRQGGAVVFWGRSPQAAPAMMALYDLKPIDVDVGPLSGPMRGPCMLPGRVRHRCPAPLDEALVHRNPCYQPWTKATLHRRKVLNG
jgi:hypothetical protein